MYSRKAAFLIVFGLLCIPFISNAQVISNIQAEFSVKARATGFHGKYGNNYVGIGYEPSMTLHPNGFWAGGVSFSENLLGGYTDINGKMTLINFHVGAKRTLAQYIHPFIYAIGGFRFTEYKPTSFSSEDEPLLSSFSLNYGLKSGLQIGKGKWRFEGSLELLSGTKSKYITPESIEKANTAGVDYRRYAERSKITGVSAGIGVTYMIDWVVIEDE